MLPITQFDLPFFDNFEIKGEYEGNKKSGKVIIFSHGFGVDRTDRGLLTDIGNVLKEEFLIIRFDYNEIIPNKNAMYVFPPSLQAKMLDHVYQYLSKTFSPFHVSIIAHSMGCVIASMSKLPQLDNLILLSPPLNSPYTSLINNVSDRPGTKINQTDISIIQGSDQSHTFVPPEFWPEMKTIDPLQQYQQFISTTQVFAIRPLQDKILKAEPYARLQQMLHHHYYELKGNHEFAPPHRQKLIDTIQQIVGGV